MKPLLSSTFKEPEVELPCSQRPSTDLLNLNQKVYLVHIVPISLLAIIK
jgi:hypothetical protein